MEKKTWLDRKLILEDQLYNNILPFWDENTTDTLHGGFFHQFDRDGTLNSTDKGTWVQGRYVWLLSWLASQESDQVKKENLLKRASVGADFLIKYAFSPDKRCYYLLSREGKPMRQRRYLFSEVFIALGLHTYGSVAQKKVYVEVAEKLVADIEFFIRTPELLPSKNLADAPAIRSHSMTMIMINLYQQMRKNTDDPSLKKQLTEKIARQIDEFYKLFYKPEKAAVLEFTALDGSIIDSPEGREINPGHSIETSWFILEEYQYTGNNEYLEKPLQMIDWAFARGWDNVYGGIFSFTDLYNHDSPHIEASMKYWWPHTEALYASLLAYRITKDEKYAELFNKTANFTLASFPDPDYAEWFGYLNRDGSVASMVKGNLWKGPFHIPRSLKKCLDLL